jgi:hypothetical protein
VPPARRRPSGSRRPGSPGSARRPSRATGGPPPQPGTGPAAPPVSAPPSAVPRVSAPATPGPPLPVRSASLVLRRLLVVAGVLVGLGLGVATAVWEVFLSPLYWGGIPLPISPVLAVLSTLGLIWFTRTVTGSTGLSLLPGVVWFVVMVAATMPRPNGSVLLPSVAWMGLVAVLAGSATWTIAAYRMIARGGLLPGPPATGKPTAR